MKDFVHLHVHDQYSQLDGLGTAEKYAATAADLGFKALASTNHGNVDGVIRHQQKCEEKKVQPIPGCELYLVEDRHKKIGKKEKRYHITTLVKNRVGWRNLLQMLTIANVEGYHFRPRVDPETFLSHCQGLIVMTGCTSSFINMPNGEQFLLDLKSEVGDDLYIEIMPLLFTMQKDMNMRAAALGKEHRIRLVATNDCHYPTKDGNKTQEVLLAMQTKTKWNNPNRWKFDVTDLYLKTYEEMATSFKKQGSLPSSLYLPAMHRTIDIAEKCKGFRIAKMDVDLPKVPGYEDRDETELLHELVEAGYDKRVKTHKEKFKKANEYRARIEEELGLICELGFQRYFLIVWELIDWCHNNDIMTGPGRGSVGGCLVAYLLFITDVDPLEHNLIFSRFISPARIDLPDIDMDFEDIKRGEIRKHLEECYGKENVAGVSTFFSLKGRAAVRDVSRVFDVPFKDVDAAAKSIVVRSGGDFRANFTIEDAFETFEDGIKFKKKYPEVSRIAMDLEGQIRGSGQHAAAMCISKDNLHLGKRCNLCVRKDTVVANWDKEDAEYMGLMKLDVLGLSALTILSETRKMVEKNQGIKIQYDDITLDDKKVYDEITKGHTVGAFQIGSVGLSQYCKELIVENFENLVQATSLWRPGTLRTGMVVEFRMRKNNQIAWDYYHPALESLTKETFGVILYQEQVMRFMYDLAGLPWKTCDTVRKVISKSKGEELFKNFQDQFVEGCHRKKTLDRDSAARVWNALSSFGSYGFNKAHAVEYSLITYWDMWCKVYHPAEFMACTLTYGSEDKKEEYIEECRRLGLDLVLPKVGYSEPHKWTTDGKRLFIPFLEIKGIGEKLAKQITNLTGTGRMKDGFFKPKRKSESISLPNKTAIANLLRINAFNPNKEATEEEIDSINELFSFDLSKDPMRKVRGIYDLLAGKGYLNKLDEIDFNQPNAQMFNYFGSMIEIRYGYRKNVLKAKKGGQEVKGSGLGDVKGLAGDLGGVYGFYKDDTASLMLVFEGDLYRRKKETIEHCEGQWLLIRANNPKKTSSIFCHEMQTGDEIKRCDFGGFKLNLISRYRHPKMDGLNKCEECPLHSECISPVYPSPGKNNIMICGEAPGWEEDEEGEGFVGKSGKKLWEELDKYGLSRDMFHVTNLVKCYPKKTKTPTKRQLTACTERWFTKEFQKVKPVLVLGLGNTNLRFWKGQESGIMNLNAQTEWTYRHNCWISWCIHPASVLYSPENKSLFEDGIKEFAAACANIGLDEVPF